MTYKISKEELANDWLYSTLIALESCMAKHGLPLYIVGARARDVAMKLMKGDEPKRRTEDLDEAIAINVINIPHIRYHKHSREGNTLEKKFHSHIE